jgi:flagellar biosynthesis/type III secretory pathway protein FliH
VVGESKVQEAIQRAVTRAEKQTARELSVNPKDVDRTLQDAVKEM